MIALLAVHGLVLVAELAERLSGKLVVLALDFLQAEDVRLVLGQGSARRARWRRRTELMFQVAIVRGIERALSSGFNVRLI